MDEERFFKLVNQFTNAGSCLFITPENKIIRVTCPFTVLYLYCDGLFPKDSMHIVMSVRCGKGNSILYEVDGKLYAHGDFKLVN